jgi:DNA-directed RNA polymerase subunit RPC12/RpoP
MGEADRGFKAERVFRDYFCSNGHETNKQFSAHLEAEEIMAEIDCPNCGLPAGLDKNNPPVIAKHEPYKTHLAYVKERRTDEEAVQLLDEAVSAVRERRIKAAEAEAAKNK